MTTYRDAMAGIESWSEPSKKVTYEFLELISPENKEEITISLFEEFDGIISELGDVAQYHALKGAYAMLNLIRLTHAKTIQLYFKKEKVYGFGMGRHWPKIEEEQE